MRSRFDPSDSTAMATIPWEIKKRSFSGLELMKISESTTREFHVIFQDDGFPNKGYTQRKIAQFSKMDLLCFHTQIILEKVMLFVICIRLMK